MEGKRVDSKLLLFTLVLVLITLLLLNYFIEGNRKDEIWNYEEIVSAEYLLHIGEKLEDRQTYYNLEQIVNQYLNSYVVKDDSEELTYKEYYKYLTENYKKYLSKREYIEVADKFMDKFCININNDYVKMDTNNIIEEVYQFENNVYLCKLNSNMKSTSGYIAIQLNTAQLEYSIVYIE